LYYCYLSAAYLVWHDFCNVGFIYETNQYLEDNMPTLNTLSRTDVSAIISILMFGVTILISAVGPAQAEGTVASDKIASPPVSLINPGYRA
tara:strand:+ start:1826 stop:2098 length:273 start_codon:yes stop_codon:yes gene_type:complete